MKLLTEAHASAKMSKNVTQGNYLSYILHLAPYKLSGVNVCPMASRGCAAACLNTAGRGRFDNVKTARLNKTKRFLNERESFMSDLCKDLDAVSRKAIKLGATPVVRLNGTSDIDWTSVKTSKGLNVFEQYPNIQFYDYTKVLRRLEKQTLNPLANYSLTFSRSEDNHESCLKAIHLGFNVAAVFSSSELPSEFDSRPVIDGDSHDLRFLDSKPSDGLGCFVGLKAKGDAKKDTSGFVIKI